MPAMPASVYPARSTPFPSYLLDTVMPLLSDTEWRMLCVVVRATLGWEDGQGGRKQTDWLTQSQLKARTGRASEALSRAVDGLVQKGLILVCNEAGNPLTTPQERRRCVGKMLFCLTPQTPETAQKTQDAQDASTRPSQPQAAQEQAEQQEAGSSLSEHVPPQSEQRYSETEQGYSETEVRKAKTTKETPTKSTDGGVQPSQEVDVDKSMEKSARRTPTPVSEPDPVAENSGSDVHRFLRAYQEQFARCSPGGEAPPIAWGRDGRLVKGLLAQYGYTRLLELLTRFFASEDAWVKKRGYALSCFPTLLPTLLMDTGGAAQPQRRAPATPVAMHPSSAPLWQQTGNIAVSDVSLFERHPDLARRVRGQPP